MVVVRVMSNVLRADIAPVPYIRNAAYTDVALGCGRVQATMTAKHVGIVSARGHIRGLLKLFVFLYYEYRTNVGYGKCKKNITLTLTRTANLFK